MFVNVLHCLQLRLFLLLLYFYVFFSTLLVNEDDQIWRQQTRINIAIVLCKNIFRQLKPSGRDSRMMTEGRTDRYSLSECRAYFARPKTCSGPVTCSN